MTQFATCALNPKLPYNKDKISLQKQETHRLRWTNISQNNTALQTVLIQE